MYFYNLYVSHANSVVGLRVECHHVARAVFLQWFCFRLVTTPDVVCGTHKPFTINFLLFAWQCLLCIIYVIMHNEMNVD